MEFNLLQTSLMSDDEEDEENETMKRAREARQREAIEKRREEIERKRKRDEEEEERNRNKKNKPEETLEESLGYQLVLIGDDVERNEYQKSISQFVGHFLGENNEFDEKLRQIDDAENFRKFLFVRQKSLMLKKTEDESIDFREKLKKFESRILKALIRLTKIKNQKIVDDWCNVFEELQILVHKSVVEEKNEKFRCLAEIFQERREEEERRKRMAIEETRDVVENNFQIEKEDVESVIQELANLSIELSNPEGKYRDTSPPRYREILTEKTMEKLIEGTQNLFVEKKSAKHRRQIHGNSENSSFSDEENDEIDFSEFFIESLKSSKHERINDKSLENEEEKKFKAENEDSSIQMTTLKTTLGLEARNKERKKVSFVEFDDSRNQMRIFAIPMDWYLTNGDDGTTLIYLDTTLAEGWKLLKNVQTPICAPRSTMKKIGRSQPLARRLVCNLEDLGLSKNYTGNENHRFIYLLKNRYYEDEENDADDDEEESFEIAKSLGLVDRYSKKELFNATMRMALTCTEAFNASFSRLTKTNHQMISTKFRPDFRRKVEKIEKEEAENGIFSTRTNIEHNLMKQIPLNGKISSVLIISDWRLVRLKKEAVRNAEIKTMPSQLGNLCFAMLEQFLMEFIRSAKIDIQHLVFAFGGSENFEISTIRRFLILILKLRGAKKMRIHWISCCWIKSDNIQYLSETNIEGKQEADENRLKNFNSNISQFIEEMKNHRKIENIDYYDICDKLIGIEENLEEIYSEYMNYFIESCGVLPNSTFFELEKRRYNSYLEDDNERPFK